MARMTSFAVDDDVGLSMDIEDSMAFTWALTPPNPSWRPWKASKHRAPSYTRHFCKLSLRAATVVCSIVAIVLAILFLVRYLTSTSSTPCSCSITFEGVRSNWTQTLCLSGDTLDRVTLKKNVSSKHKVGIEKFSFRGCETLSSLDLFGLTDFKNLPENFADLKGLRAINLGWTHIKAIPNNIGELTNLEGISVRDTPLEVLPESITNCRKLETLDLRTSRVKKLPISLDKLKSLRNLYLRDSKLVALPNNIGDLINLRELIWSPRDNGLGPKYPKVQFPKSFEKLEKLELLKVQNDWRITSLPTYITKFDKLKTLDLDGCRKFNRFPEDFGKLINLEELGMSNTKFVYLPEDLIKLVNLKRLHLEHVTFHDGSLPSVICKLCDLHHLEFLAVTGSNVGDLKLCNKKEKIKACAAIARAQPKSPIHACLDVPS